LAEVLVLSLKDNTKVFAAVVAEQVAWYPGFDRFLKLDTMAVLVEEA